MEIVYKEKSYKIVGACFEVYTEKGNRNIDLISPAMTRLLLKLKR